MNGQVENDTSDTTYNYIAKTSALCHLPCLDPNAIRWCGMRENLFNTFHGEKGGVGTAILVQ